MHMYEKNDISQHTFINRLTSGPLPMSISAADVLYGYIDNVYDGEVRVDFETIKAKWTESSKEDLLEDIRDNNPSIEQDEIEDLVFWLYLENGNILYIYNDDDTGFYSESD